MLDFIHNILVKTKGDDCISNSNDFKVYDFGARLKELRLKAGYTQDEIANKLDVHRNTISGYENNTQDPPYNKIKSLALIYNCTSDYILGLDNREIILIDDLPESKQKIILNLIDDIRAEYAETKK